MKFEIISCQMKKGKNAEHSFFLVLDGLGFIPIRIMQESLVESLGNDAKIFDVFINHNKKIVAEDYRRAK